MNYLKLINHFWTINEVYSFDSKEIALFFYLLKINNLTSWSESFNHNNHKVLSSIGIKDRRTLSEARNRLKQANLIDFNAKNGSANVKYWIIDPDKTCTETSAKNAQVSEQVATSAKNAQVSAQVDVQVSGRFMYSKDKLNKNIYTPEEFLKTWEKARMHWDKKPTNILKLNFVEQQNFNELLKDYEETEFKDALNGLFFQKTLPAVRVRPTWLLKRENFENMRDCWCNQTKMYENAN